jgi:TPR repeat protein
VFGFGVAKDESKGFQMLLKMADQGVAHARTMLSQFFSCSAPALLSEAVMVQWYSEAAAAQEQKQGSKYALQALRWYYLCLWLKRALNVIVAWLALFGAVVVCSLIFGFTRCKR